MVIKQDFLDKTKMRDVHGNQTGVEDVMDYLSNPAVVYKMIIASEMDLPVLTLIAKELETVFNNQSNFPIAIMGNNKNATAKQNVGRMIKFVMAQYGYTPIYGGLSKRARIPAISGSAYFLTSSIYAQTGIPKYKIEIISK